MVVSRGIANSSSFDGSCIRIRKQGIVSSECRGGRIDDVLVEFLLTKVIGLAWL